jgi:hypothetical protein
VPEKYSSEYGFSVYTDSFLRSFIVILPGIKTDFLAVGEGTVIYIATSVYDTLVSEDVTFTGIMLKAS